MRKSGTVMSLVSVALAVPVVFGSCSEDNGLTPADKGDGNTTSFLDGQIDPNNNWMTAVPVQVEINAPGKGTVTAQTIMNDKVTILGEKTVNGGAVMYLDVPQGENTSFGLVFDDGTGFKQYKRVDLSNAANQVVDVTFSKDSSLKASAKVGMAKAATNTSLYGASIMPSYGYINFGSWAWDDLSKAVPENVAAQKNVKAIKDFEIMARGEVTSVGELQSKETVYLSFLYGHTGNIEKRIIGYYVNSLKADGTPDYSDIEFHDIADVMTYDYFDGNAKVQYQLDGNAKWYDANFDYADKPSNPNGARLPARRGDDAYGTLNVNQAYGKRITAVRGLSYKLEIPKGKAFGFYLKDGDKAISNDQKQKMIAAGVPANKIPTKLANYTKAAFNHGQNFKGIRSAFAIYDNFTFMGLDDTMDGGDGDCNDVTFALSNVRGEKMVPLFTKETTESDINKPTIENPDAPDYTNPDPDPTDKPSGETTTEKENYESLQHWTLAFENAGKDNDFDFNDVVLEVTPDTKNNKAYVYLMATGAQRRTELYFQKSDGSEQYLGEVHELFNVKPGTYVNTKAGQATVSPVLVADDLEWTAGSTLENSRQRFILKVYDDNDTSKLSRIVKSDELIGGSPQVLCVAGHWSWPLETTNVATAYPLLGEWAINFNKTEHWNWYSHPSKGLVVKPLAPSHKSK